MFYRNKIDNIEFNSSKFNCFLFFDTVSNRNNLKRSGQLVIELKVHLQPDNTKTTIGPFADNDNRSFKTDAWPDHILRDFKTLYQKTGQGFWDRKFILTNKSYSAFDLFFTREKNGKLVDRTKFEIPILISRPTLVDGVITNPEVHNWQLQHNIHFTDDSTMGIISVHPDLECRFVLKLVDTAGEAHKSIRLIYITHVKEKTGAFQRIPQFSPTYYRSDSGNYSQSDILPERQSFMGIPLTQNTHIHEIGHAIGLDHSGEAMKETQCMAKIAAGDRFHSVCYGSTFKSASNVLGRGNNLLPMNAEPWKHAIKLMTKSDAWQVKMR